MAVTYNDAIEFMSNEIEHFNVVSRVEFDPKTKEFYQRNIEIMSKIRDVVLDAKDEFDPELHKFSMIACREVMYSREFIVEAKDRYEAEEKLRDCYDCREFYLNSSECDTDDEEFSIIDVNTYSGEVDGCEVCEGVWEA